MVKPLPAGGWGSTARTGGLVVPGFTEAEVAAALDRCDNDRVKAVALLKKSAKTRKEWRPHVESTRNSLPNGPLKDALARLLGTPAAQNQGLPAKEKAFRNFCISALNLHKQPDVAGEVWRIYKEALTGGGEKVAEPPKAEETRRDASAQPQRESAEKKPDRGGANDDAPRKKEAKEKRDHDRERNDASARKKEKKEKKEKREKKEKKEKREKKEKKEKRDRERDTNDDDAPRKKKKKTK